ncbi:hypothetical protein BLOT_014618 [Blomia tropicalis]|nr:hypothetical protein BLOT_014618 [Blomia tropicalis]
MATTYRLHIYDITGLDFGTCHSSIVGLLLLLLDLLYQKRCPMRDIGKLVTHLLFFADLFKNSFCHLHI